jgi:hypothetical protein
MARKTRLVATGYARANSAWRKQAAIVLRPRAVRYAADDDVADIAGTHFLQYQAERKKRIDLALDEELHRAARQAP